MIRIEHLTKKYGRFKAVDDLTFSVERGESLALWGPNGAGKTTVIRCVLGLVRCRGLIEVAGIDAQRRGREARRAIGYVPQELALYDDLRVGETMDFFARLKRVGWERSRRVLEQVGLAEHGRKRVRELSGGMKQRLVLGLAQLTDPPVMILDEPTSNLDASGRDAFVSMLLTLSGAGKTILFSSHRIEEIRQLAHRVVAMERGLAGAICRPEQLAEAAGVRCMMRVFVEPGKVDRAVDVLRTDGFTASRNGHGLMIEVDPLEKAGPLKVLSRERIGVNDFEVGPICEPAKGENHV